MYDAEFVGGILDDASDPRATAEVLATLLSSQQVDLSVAKRTGIPPELVEVARKRFGSDTNRIDAACREGAAWVLGRRSLSLATPWELVVSLSAGTELPVGVRRTTGETMIQLIVQATNTLRLAAPFVDSTGLSFMVDALAAATARSVALEIQLPTRSTHAEDALEILRTTVERSGDSSHLVVSRLRSDAPWAHLKVLVSDSKSAYIGSANVTGAGISGHNLELGVLVQGETVKAVESILDIYRQR